MSTPTARCPECSVRFPVAGSARSAVCPKCGTKFRSPGGEPAPAPARAKPVRPRPAADRTERDRPRSRTRPSERAAKAGGSLLPVVLVMGGLFTALVVGGVVAVSLVLFARPPVAQSTSPTSPDTTPATDPVAVPPVTPDPLDRLLGDVPPQTFEVPDRNPDPFGDPKPPKPPEAAKPARPGPTYAALVPQAITPAPLTADTAEVKLPGKVSDTCNGGGGRFFVLHIPSAKMLAVFDVTQAKVVKYLPVTSDAVRVAAGMNKLIVAYPSENTLVRYDLGTFEKEATHQWAGDGEIDHIALGSASAGPLLVTYGSDRAEPRTRGTFLDPATFKPVDIQFENATDEVRWGFGGAVHADPSGRVFLTGRGANTLVVRGGWARLYARAAGGEPGRFRPTLGPDGNVYSAGGVYAPDGTPVGIGVASRNNLLPAAEGPWHLRCVAHEKERGDVVELPISLEVRSVGDPRPLAVYKNVPPVSRWRGEGMYDDQRVHFVPSANLLVTIPQTDDRLVLRAFDLEAAATVGSTDHPRVVSRPPAAVPGQLFDYQMVVKSQKGGVRYQLDVGPPGMTVDAAGKVTWPVPADLKQPEPVVVGVTDASGRDVPHAFELTRGEAGRWARPLSRTFQPEKATDPDPLNGKKLVPQTDRVFELKPPPIDGKSTVELGGVADACCVGGGGRFLIYRLPKEQRLVVLDVTAGRVVKHLSLSEPDALFAAGMTKLFVYNPAAGLFVRYDLETFRKELTAPTPFGGTPKRMHVGHSSEGPVYVGGTGVAGRRGYGFLYASTLTEVVVSIDGGERERVGPNVDNERFRQNSAFVSVAPDGRSMTWGESLGFTRMMSLGEYGATAKDVSSGFSDRSWSTVVGPDGHLFDSQGVLTPDLKRRDDRKRELGNYLPATSGGWYLKAEEQSGGKYVVDLRFTTDATLDITLPAPDGLNIPPKKEDPFRVPDVNAPPPPHKAFTLAERVSLIPDAEALAVLDPSCERVFLHRLPLKQLVTKAKAKSVLVVGRPPQATRGQQWQYTPDVWADAGNVTVKVAEGPNGMTAAGGGVSWAVPADFRDELTPVKLVVSAGGREVTQAFELTVREATAPPVAVLRPKVAELPRVVPADAVAAVPPRKVFPITPSKAKDKSELTLPGPTDAHCFAGGGRFVLFRIPDTKQLVVFDASAGTLLKALPLPTAKAPFAAGMTEWVVFDSSANEFIRYSLSTLNEVGRVKNPLPAKPDAIAIGHATDGPLLAAGKGVGGGDNLFALLDPEALTRIDRDGLAAVGTAPDLVNVPRSYPNEVVASASADGRSFVYFSTIKLERFVVALTPGKPAVVTGVAEWTHFALPGYDGQWATSRGLVDPAARPPLVRPNDPSELLKVLPGIVPAADGPWYLDLPPDPQRFKFGPDADKPDDGRFTLRLTTVSACALPVAEPAGVVMASERLPGVAPVPGRWQKRFVLLPQAELLLVFNPNRDRVHLNRLDPKALFDAAKPDLCLIPPNAPPPIQPGKKWTYTPPVWTPRGGVTVQLTTAPAGMTAAGGTLTWEPPADLLDGEVRVSFTATDAGGQKAVGDFVWPVAAAPTLLEVTARPDFALTPAPKKGVPALPFETAWAEYLASTGLAPATFKDAVVKVEMPDRPTGDGVAAGGGRYWAVAVSEDTGRGLRPLKDTGGTPKKVAVVDLATAKVAYSLDLPKGFDDGDAARKVVAADRTRVFTVVPVDADKRQFRLTSYAVATGKEERSATVTLPGPAVSAVAAGASGTGTPLLVLTADGHLVAIDPDTLTVLDGVVGPPKGVTAWKPACLAVSADGCRVVCQSAEKDAPMFHVGTWTGKGYEWATGGEKGVVTDGRVAVTTGGMIYTSAGSHHPTGAVYAPGGQRAFFGQASAVGPLLQRSYPKKNGTPGDSEHCLVFGPGQPPAGAGVFAPSLFSHPSVTVVEPLGVLVAATRNDQNWATPHVALYRFDLPKLLAASTGTAPLLTVHTPPAERGKKYTLTPLAWLTATERPTLTLKAGPPGMTLTPDGRLEWPVPDNYAEAFTPVTLAATAASGAEASVTVYPVVVPAGSVRAVGSPVVVGPKPPFNPPVVTPPKPPVVDPSARKSSPFAIARQEYLAASGLKPATFPGESAEVKLSGAARSGFPLNGQVLVGGHGRYLAFRFEVAKKLQVVDLSTAEVTFTLPFDSTTTAAAMNRSHLFVRDSAASTLARYDLSTGKCDKTVTLDLGASPGLLVGASGTSDTPLLAVTARPNAALLAIDPATLGVYRGAIEWPLQGVGAYPPVLSADGRRVALQVILGDSKKERPAFYIGTLIDRQFKWAAAADGLPGKVGVVDKFTPSGRVLSPTGWYDPKGEAVVANAPSPARRMWWYQASDGPLAVVSVPSDPANPRDLSGVLLAFSPDQPPFSPPVNLFGLSPLAVCEGLGVAAGEGRNGALVIQKLNVEKGLTAFHRGNDPLVALQPPVAERGRAFVTTPAVWAAGDEKARLRLDAGPPGMKLTDAGQLEWAVPLDFPDPFATVTLTATTAKGKSTVTVFPAVVGLAPGADRPRVTLVEAKDFQLKADARVLPPKEPVATAKAAPFADAWDEYLKGTGLKPATFKGDSVQVKLNGSTSVAPMPAGGGRYLVYTLTHSGFDVVDLTTGTITLHLPTPTEERVAAVNLTHLFTYDPAAHKLQRYDLATGKNDKSVAFKPTHRVSRFVGPSASATQPLLVLLKSVPPKVIAIDPNTLEECDTMATPGKETEYQTHKPLAMSPDGRRVTYLPDTEADAAIFHLGTWNGTKYEWTDGSDRKGNRDSYQVLATASGLFTPSRAFTPEGTRVTEPPAQAAKLRRWLPSTAGPSLASITESKPGEPLSVGVQFGPGQPVVSTTFTVKQVFAVAVIVEPIGVLVLHPYEANAITIHKLDVPKLLADHPGDEPLIALFPPAAERGKVFACTPAVWAKGGERPTLRLEEAPKGMTLTPAGVLEWAVPKDYDEPFVTIHLAASTAGGKSSALTLFPAVAGAGRPGGKPEEPTGNVPPVKPNVPPPDPVKPPPPVVAPPPVKSKEPVASAAAVPFADAWAEYLNGTGLKPAVFKGDSVQVTLSGESTRPPAAAGGGRYLIYTVSKTAADIIDLTAGVKAFSVPLAGDWVLTAANRTHLFVLDPKEQTIDRYELATGEKDKSAKLDPGGPAESFVGPAAADGPLCLRVGSPAAALLIVNPATLSAKATATPLPKDMQAHMKWKPFTLSADGRRAAYTPDADTRAPVFQLGRWEKDTFHWTPASNPWVSGSTERLVTHAPTGFYTPRVMYDPDGRPAKPDDVSLTRSWYPSAVGPTLAVYSPWGKPGQGHHLFAHFGPDQPPIDTPLLASPKGFGRVTLVEPLGVVVEMEGGNKTLRVSKFDLKKMLADHRGEEPLVAVYPPSAERGKRFDVVPAVWAKGNARPTLKLTECPKGMTMTADGRVTWDVPKDFAEPHVTVTLTATTADGKATKITVYPAVVSASK